LLPKVKKVKTRKIFECTFCNVQITKKSHYKEHIHSRRHRLAVEEKVSREGLAINIDEEAPLRPEDGKVVCETCGIACSSKIVYQRHTETHSTSRKRFKCTICHKQYLHESTLQEHQDSSVICEHCGKAFSTQKRLLYHVQNVHTRKERYRHRCAKCGVIYFYKHQLTLHQRTHQSSEERVKCGHCGEIFRHESKKLDHIRQVHEGKVIQCPHCPRTYSLAHHLKIHMRQHTGEKPFVCPTCGKGFGYKEHLNRHRREVCSLERMKKVQPSSSHTHSPIIVPCTPTQVVSAIAVEDNLKVGREDDNS